MYNTRAKQIFEKHWKQKTGKDLDATTEHHMQYCIDAIAEALMNGKRRYCPQFLATLYRQSVKDNYGQYPPDPNLGVYVNNVTEQ